MAVFEIIKNTAPADGEILVTGASGGVGSMAVAIFARLGFVVVAASGKENAHDYLKSIGASKVISREELMQGKERPLLKPRWAGVVDTVGGEMLAHAIKAANPLAVVAACGNVASVDIPINVFPFILRGVKLVGIDSQNCPMAHRKEMWQKLAGDWKPSQLENMVKEIYLDELNPAIERILKGGITGRIVVNLR
jgi:putative YhdH/YhfP family quinone oxidoreductase